MGENGAGKSTLMKILGGAHAARRGRDPHRWKEPSRIESVRDAKRLGIALIHQELMLAPNLDIAANIFLGNEGGATGLPSVRCRRATCTPAPGSCSRAWACRSRPRRPVSALTAGQMQMVEIAKALAPERAHPHHGRADVVAHER